MKLFLLIIFTVLISESSYAEIRHADKHVHGINYVQIVLNGKQLAIRYEMPIVQISSDQNQHNGHEQHKHDHKKNDKHDNNHNGGHDINDGNKGYKTNSVNPDQLKFFRKYNELFTLPSLADCSLKRYDGDVQSVLTHEGNQSDTGHKDVILNYEFICTQTDALKEIQFNSFSHFNELQHVIIKGLINGKAIVAELDKETPLLVW